MLMQSGESPKMNTSVPSMSGPAKPKDSSAPHLPFAVLKVRETVGLDRTWRRILRGMPDLAMDLMLPKAREAPESSVYSRM